MVNDIRIRLLFVFCFIGVATAQQTVRANPADDPITGHGTKHVLTKFTGKNSIGNSGIAEINGQIKTNESISAGAIEGTVNDPNAIAVVGNNFGTTGDAIGVSGTTYSEEGIGVQGIFNSPTGSGIGVKGATGSALAIGGVFANVVQSGGGVAGFGYVTSPDGGIGLLGRVWSNTGIGIAVKGETFTPDGVAGLFDNTAGGNILIGATSGANKFRVDGTGRVFADGGYQAGGADFAESLEVNGARALYEPGDLLVIDTAGRSRLNQAHEPYSTLVAGVYSTKPGVLASMHGMDDPRFASEVPLAIVGIVPCKVISENGPINVGDLLVSSSSAGRAMKGTDRGRMLGAVVGKALEPLAEGSGVIQVLITLQ